MDELLQIFGWIGLGLLALVILGLAAVGVYALFILPKGFKW